MAFIQQRKTAPKELRWGTDPDLQSDLLRFITAYIPTMPGYVQKDLLTYLKGEVDTSLAMAAFNQIWKGDRELYRRLKAVAGGPKMEIAVLAPSLFVWAFNQPWADTIKTDSLLSRWKRDTLLCPQTDISARANATRMLNRANDFMAVFAPLIPSIVPERREPLVSGVYNALQWLLTLDTLDTVGNRPALWTLAQALGKMAHLCGNSLSKKGLPMPEQWVRTTIGGLAKNRNEQMNLAKSLVHSDLPKDLKLRALHACQPIAWVQPRVHAFLLPTLPADECLRFEHLPWESAPLNVFEVPESVRDNRALMQLYCPSLAPVVDIATVEDDWLNKSAIGRLVARFTAPPEDALDLPDLNLDHHA